MSVCSCVFMSLTVPAEQKDSASQQLLTKTQSSTLTLVICCSNTSDVVNAPDGFISERSPRFHGSRPCQVPRNETPPQRAAPENTCESISDSGRLVKVQRADRVEQEVRHRNTFKIKLQHDASLNTIKTEKQ